MLKKILLGIGLLILVTVSIGGVSLWREIAALEGITFADIDPSQLTDGEYLGSYKAGPVSVTVQVSIESGQITHIDILEHIQGRGKSAEKVIDSIINKQSLDVDVVSGATVSSKAIIGAVEQALN